METLKSKMALPMFALAMALGVLGAWGAGRADVSAAPRIIGAMKDVMWSGKLQGKVDLDTLADKKHLYGLGPLEYLEGEILIVDGECYTSRIGKDSSLKVAKTFQAKAPFFGYANIPKWREAALPDSVSSLDQIERYLDAETKNLARPFFFRIEGTVDSAAFHVVNLPKGAKVASPQDAHAGQREFRIADRESRLIGFFSTAHQAIFTHHDTYLHIHLITKDKKQMGHLDRVGLKRGARLYLPAP